MQRFAFARAHSVLRPVLAVTGMGPTRIRIELDDDELRVRMGPLFRAAALRTAIIEATAYDGRVGGWGVHGWRGRWLVNTTSTGLVTLSLDPPARARLLGIGLRPHVLRLSLADRDAFLAALAVRPGPHSIS